jgi:hypothetical protein
MTLGEAVGVVKGSSNGQCTVPVKRSSEIEKGYVVVGTCVV